MPKMMMMMRESTKAQSEGKKLTPLRKLRGTAGFFFRRTAKNRQVKTPKNKWKRSNLSVFSQINWISGNGAIYHQSFFLRVDLHSFDFGTLITVVAFSPNSFQFFKNSYY